MRKTLKTISFMVEEELPNTRYGDYEIVKSINGKMEIEVNFNLTNNKQSTATTTENILYIPSELKNELMSTYEKIQKWLDEQK